MARKKKEEVLPTEQEQNIEIDDGEMQQRHELLKKEFLKEQKARVEFHNNLVFSIDNVALSKIAAALVSELEKDKEVQSEWIRSIEDVKDYLGFKIEDFVSDKPFRGACKSFDSSFATALIKFYSTARGEFLPADGPIEIHTNHKNEYTLKENLSKFFNCYFTEIDRDYYNDFEKMFLYLGLYGSVFKKIYFDVFEKKILSRYISPEEFLLDYSCTNALNSERITQIFHLSKRELQEKQSLGIYLDTEILFNNIREGEEVESFDEIDSSVYEESSDCTLYEVHTYLNLRDYISTEIKSKIDDRVLPYIIILHKDSNKILSILRNWEKDDPTFKKINYFVQYNYLPGFGIYGIGLGNLVGTNSITSTKLLRQLVDAGTYQNLPGGVRTGTLKNKDKELIIGPGEFPYIATNGEPIDKIFQTLPYKGPSESLRALRAELIEDMKVLSSTTELGMMKSKEDIAPATMYGILDQNLKIQSAVFCSIYRSFCLELSIFLDIFKQKYTYLDLEEVAKRFHLSSEVFYNFDFKITPRINPSDNSSIHRLIKADTLLKVASSDPGIHDMHAVYRFNYLALGMSEQEIQSILPPKPEQDQLPPPITADPVTENIAILEGKGVQAEKMQNHDAHIVLHGNFAQQNKDVESAITAHIQDHLKYKYLIDMERRLGYSIPHDGEIPPEIQNEIAVKLASTIVAKEEPEDQLDTNQLVEADIQQRYADIASREKIANLRAKTDIFKSQLNFEKEKLKYKVKEND